LSATLIVVSAFILIHFLLLVMENFINAHYITF
jgi:hypothetical protein